ATERSLSVVSCLGSAASRSTIVEYWFWSATQTRTGPGDLKKGAQNTSMATGRESLQATTPANVPTNKRTSSSPALCFRRRFETRDRGTGILGTSGSSAIPG